jgi:hypothetical protein
MVFDVGSLPFEEYVVDCGAGRRYMRAQGVATPRETRVIRIGATVEELGSSVAAKDSKEIKIWDFI